MRLDRKQMDKKLFDALQIRFVKVRFRITFNENSLLPKDKVSAIRGGIGEMLLRTNCVRDRHCENCDFGTECIVQKTMYSKFEIKPAFVTTGGSAGYVLECENQQESFKAGEKLDFYLILFGKAIVYFYQLYQAVSMLGSQEGIGKYHARFLVTEIKNMEGENILKASKLDMDNYVVHMVYDYILFKKARLPALTKKNEVMMFFDTPLTLKYQKSFLGEFRMDALLNAIKRRIYIVDCYEGIDLDFLHWGENGIIPEIICQDHYLTGIHRYSSRKDEKMVLRGIKGYAVLTGISDDVFTLLLAGELIHIGKNTSFGFGRFHLKLTDD